MDHIIIIMLKIIILTPFSATLFPLTFQ